MGWSSKICDEQYVTNSEVYSPLPNTHDTAGYLLPLETVESLFEIKPSAPNLTGFFFNMIQPTRCICSNDLDDISFGPWTLSINYHFLLGLSYNLACIPKNHRTKIRKLKKKKSVGNFSGCFLTCKNFPHWLLPSSILPYIPYSPPPREKKLKINPPTLKGWKSVNRAEKMMFL